MDKPATANVARLCAVVIAYNQREQTLACLRALSGVTYPAWTILLIDNGSTDGMAEAVAQAFPQVGMLRLDENQGYAGGTNLGVTRALADGADYVLVLNNDVRVPPDAPGALVAAAEADPHVAVVGSKIYYADESRRLQSAGGTVDWRTMRLQLIGQGELDQGQYNCAKDVDFVSGCAMLIRAQAWCTIGEFDPAYFLYYEEVDWCLRARRAGWKVMYIPFVAMWHADQTSTGTEPGLVMYYTTRNRLLLAERYAGRWTRLAIYVDALQRAGRSMYYLLASHQRPQAVATLRAVRDFARGRLGRGPYPAIPK
jgi:GT2 family glycosyltransferase